MSEQLNREAWLNGFIALAAPMIKKRTGLNLPDGQVKISVGFPSKGGTRAKNRVTGQCFHIEASERKFHQIFVHPQLVTPKDVGGVVLHEILHAMLPPGTGHRKPFARAAEALGLEGKPTATTVGEELEERIKEIAEQLGDYPHEVLDGFGGPKQSTRLLKVMCPLCGYVARVTSKWLDEAGSPICPQCQVEMEESGAGDQAESPLTAIDQTTEYAVKATVEAKRRALAQGHRLVYDPRWAIRMNRRGTDIRWWVIDFGPSIDERGIAVMDPNPPRLTTAESRGDAIALLEALRDGTMTYDDIEVDDDNPDLDDPELDEENPEPYFGDEIDETADFEDADGDPRFQHEIEGGISIDDIAERERIQREGWVKE